MKSLTAISLALFLTPGVVFAQGPENPADSLPVPPHIEHASAWFARASQEYGDNTCFLPQFSQPFLQSIPVPPDPWDAVKELKVGKKIRIVNSDFTRLKGRFVSATPDAITFRLPEASREEMTLPRRDVRMVSIRHSKAKQVLLMILAGALVGAAAMADASHDCGPCSWDETNPASGTALAVGAGVGALTFGLAEALAGPSDEVIYVHNPGATLAVEVPESSTTSNGSATSALGAPESRQADAPPTHVSLPGAAGQPEGGNVFVPSDAEATKEATEAHEKGLN